MANNTSTGMATFHYTNGTPAFGTTSATNLVSLGDIVAQVERDDVPPPRSPISQR